MDAYAHANPTQGDRRSPILAAFQKTPLKPVLCESKSVGKRARMYAQVQMKSKRVLMKDLKSNSADMGAAGRTHVKDCVGEGDAARQSVRESGTTAKRLSVRRKLQMCVCVCVCPLNSRECT